MVTEQMAMDRAKAQFEQKLLPMLIESYKKGVVDFRLRIDTPTHLYVHPDGVDGETVDINWGTGG